MSKQQLGQRYVCPECGSDIANNNKAIAKHNLSKKHLVAIGEYNEEKKTQLEHNKNYMKGYRAKQREVLGDDEYKKIESLERLNRLHKQKQQKQPEQTKQQGEDNRFDTILSMLKKKAPNLSEKTLKINLQKVGLVYKIVFDETYNYKDVSWLEDGVKISKNIVKHYKAKDASDKTISNIFASLASVLKILNHKDFEKSQKLFSEISVKLQGKVENQLATGELTEKQKIDWQKWEDIMALKKHIDDEQYATDTDRALYYLYTSIAPRRLEYNIMKLARMRDEDKLDKSFNYLIVDEEIIPQKIIINKYKSPAMKKWAKQGRNVFEIQLTDPLQDVLDNYIAEEQVRVGEFVFRKGNKSSYTDSEFSKLISNLFNQFTDTNMTLNGLRHSYATYKLKKAKNQNDRNELAWNMGTSVDTLLKNYEKFELR